jgi:hypothetical protein
MQRDLVVYALLNVVAAPERQAKRTQNSGTDHRRT